MSNEQGISTRSQLEDETQTQTSTEEKPDKEVMAEGEDRGSGQGLISTKGVTAGSVPWNQDARLHQFHWSWEPGWPAYTPCAWMPWLVSDSPV